MSEALDQEKKHAPVKETQEAAEKGSLGLQSPAERRLSSPRLQPLAPVNCRPGVRRRVWRVVGLPNTERRTIADASEMVGLLTRPYRDLVDGGPLVSPVWSPVWSEPGRIATRRWAEVGATRHFLQCAEQRAVLDTAG